MQAVTFQQFGEPSEVLSIQSVDIPKPGPGQVRVRMLASPVNPSDLMTIRGTYGKKPKLPAIPGYEGVGIVEESGGGLLGKFMVGKRVAVLNGDTGNWREHTIVSAKQAVMISKSLPIEQAAMFFVNPSTAYIMTQKVLAIPTGAWLLQSAAGSAVGKMVIRLGKRFGFRTLNIVRRKEQVAELTKLGADKVIVSDGGDLAEQVRSATGGTGVKYAIDPVGGKLGSAMIGCLGADGRMLLFGTLSNEPLVFSPRELMTAPASVEGFWLGNYMMRRSIVGKLSIIRAVGKLMKEGILGAEIAEQFPLAKVHDAVAAAEVPGRAGKILLRIAEK